MDKKSKEALRRYKKSRQQASSSDSSSSESDSSSSYSSSDSERERHRKKKSMRRDSSSDDERRKREKRELCQKKLERKKDHLKRKLKAAKLKKRAAAAAAALSSHSYRALSPATQAKLKKIAERDRLRAVSKEHREREKLRAREREREHHRGGSRSPTKITKIRIHQDVKRQKSPPRMHQHMLSREKIIIQARTRDRTPSAEREARQRHEHKLRHEELVRERERRDRDRERAEREAARDKERAEALARCQERQRERERLAREKLRREEEEKKYGSGGGGGGSSSIVGAGSGSSERMLQRPSERELALSRGYNSRERSLEAVERSRHLSKRDLDMYEREPDYIESDRRALLDREDLRRDHRDYIPSSSSSSRRREISPVPDPYVTRIRDPRDLYPEEEQRERPFKRTYVEDPRDREPWMEQRDLRERGSELHKPPPRDYEIEPELMYPDERERMLRERERKVPARVAEWNEDWQIQREHEWEEPVPPGRSGFVGGPKRGAPHTLTSGKLMPREKRQPSEPDWDTGEVVKDVPSSSKLPISDSQRDWIEHDQRDVIETAPHNKPPPPHSWQMDWREGEEQSYARGPPPPHMAHMHHRSDRGGRGGFRRGGMMDHGERNPQVGAFRAHPPHAPPALMNLQMHGGPGFHGNPRFPHKRQMTFNNPNVMIRKQQAVLAAAKAAAQASAVAAATTAVAAAKAAAQSAANATTNPGILGQVSTVSRPGSAIDEKPEAGEIVSGIKVEAEKTATTPVPAGAAAVASSLDVDKAELSEISDSEDDILLRTDKKPKTDSDTGELTEAGDELPVKVEQSTSNVAIESMITDVAAAAVADIKPDMLAVVPAVDPMEIDEKLSVVEKHEVEEDMPDFEEISDGELEEEARHKGVGDALGVDWASLIAETKRQADNAVVNPNYHTTTAKQRWQAHRITLSLGISMCMAGEKYARRILRVAKEQLEAEMQSLQNKRAIKAEVLEEDDPDSKPQLKIEEINEDGTVKVEPKSADDNCNNNTIDVEKMHPLACMQVAERRRQWSQQKLIANVCGPNSRALSARRDLQLRRQLCGLPTRECNLPRTLKPTNDKLKAMALSLFARACEVK